MSGYNHDRAIGCRIGYKAVIKAVRYVDPHERIPASASRHRRRVLKANYGRQLYNAYGTKRPKLRLVG